MTNRIRPILCAAMLAVSFSAPAFANDAIGEKIIDRPPDNYLAVQHAAAAKQDRVRASGPAEGEALVASAYSGGASQPDHAGRVIRDAMISPSIGGPLNLFAELDGEWKGSGETYLDRFGRDLNISCELSINDGESNTSLKGECGALFLKKAIGIDLKHTSAMAIDGTYHALEEGPTRLEGQMTAPDTLLLTMHWPKLVMGDREATMKLKRVGPNTLRQIVSDKVEGQERVTSDITFERKI